MDKARELKSITKRVLGNIPAGFYNEVDKLFDEAGVTNSSLLSATRNIERAVKLFVGVEHADKLAKAYKEFFRNNPSYL